MAHFTEVDFYSNSGYYNYYNNFFGASSKFYCGLLYRIPNKSLAFYLKYGCGIELFEAAAVSIGDSGVNVQSENYKLHFENYLQLGFAYFF